MFPAAALLLLGLVAAFNLRSPAQSDQKAIVRIEQKLKIDLPVGTSFQDVQSYLQRERIEHSWLEKDQMFMAILRDIEKNWPVTESAQIYIRMDANKRVRSVEVESVFTGP